MTARRRRAEDDARRKSEWLVSRQCSYRGWLRRASTADDAHERVRRLGARAAHELDGARQLRAELVVPRGRVVRRGGDGRARLSAARG